VVREVAQTIRSACHIPTEKKTQPSDVRAAVRAALTSGAAGVILSRKYSEMKLANLAAAGEALKEIGV
jgi:hypothetical protein